MKKINIKGALVSTAASMAGGATAGYVNKIEFVANLSPLVRSLVKAAVGKIVIPRLGKGKFAGVANDFGSGMAGVAGVEFLNATVTKDDPISIAGVIPTLGNIDNYPGLNDDPTVIPTLGDSTNPFPFGE